MIQLNIRAVILFVPVMVKSLGLKEQLLIPPRKTFREFPHNLQIRRGGNGPQGISQCYYEKKGDQRPGRRRLTTGTYHTNFWVSAWALWHHHLPWRAS